MSVDITAPGKLLLLSIVSCGCIAVIITNMVTGNGDTTAAWATLASIIGYVIGNGVGAKRGVEQAPVFSPAKSGEAFKVEAEALQPLPELGPAPSSTQPPGFLDGKG